MDKLGLTVALATKGKTNAIDIFGNSGISVDVDIAADQFGSVNGAWNGGTTGFKSVSADSTYNGENNILETINNNQIVSSFVIADINDRIDFGPCSLAMGAKKVTQSETLTSTRAASYTIWNDIAGDGSSFVNNQLFNANVQGSSVTSNIKNCDYVTAITGNIVEKQAINDNIKITSPVGTASQTAINEDNLVAVDDININQLIVQTLTGASTISKSQIAQEEITAKTTGIAIANQEIKQQETQIKNLNAYSFLFSDFKP